MTISLHNLTLGYDRHPAVHHLDGIIEEASLMAIVGPNGGGKSTLLKALIGMIHPLSGSIDFENILPQEIAYLPQTSEVDQNFPISVLDVVQAGAWPQIGAWRSITKDMQQKSLAALNQVGLESYLDRPISTLSLGQWQRVLFARLYMQNAHLLLLDEPFAAIDSRTKHDLIDCLQQWNSEGRTIIAVIHDMALAREIFPTTLLLAKECIAWGPTSDVLSDQNLAKAQNLAGQWIEQASACHRNERQSA